MFLISLKTDGVWLNLTAADHVIHMDPWWNPAAENQALDRAHRIGQTRPMTIYRLVTKGTVEEQVVTLHHHKRDLTEWLLEGADTPAASTPPISWRCSATPCPDPPRHRAPPFRLGRAATLPSRNAEPRMTRRPSSVVSLKYEHYNRGLSSNGRPSMPRGRQLPPVVLTDEQREQMTALSESTSMPYGLVQRARIVLACAQGLTNAAVAKRLAVSPSAVGKWRRRFLERGVQGLHDELRPGRPRTYDDEKVAVLINRALQQKPDHAGAWSVRLMAEAEGVSKSTVQRWFSLFGVKPHLSDTFKLSSDPFFIEKVRDVTGLYLNPPDNAMVLCVDEKSQIQALNRTQPTLPAQSSEGDHPFHSQRDRRFHGQ